MNSDVMSALKKQLETVFTHLHNNPERSWHEVETTKYIAQLLEEHNFDVHLFDTIPGLYIEIGSGSPVVALRTDIDALWQDVGGEMKANHSCGHDGHMTMAIGCCLLLKKLIEEQQLDMSSSGTIRVIFQPAEEKGQGALAIVDRGIMDDVDYLFGVHLRPIQELQDGMFSPALHHGASMMLSCEIYGEEAHAARPHLGKNAIEIGSSLVDALKAIHVDTTIPWSVKVTRFQAGGESGNIIPGKAILTMDARAQTNVAMKQLSAGIDRGIRAVEEMYNARISQKVLVDIAAAEVSDAARDLLRQAIIETAGAEHLAEEIVTPGGEDFHFYTKERPTIKAAMLGLGCGLVPGLHHPHMTFNDQQLIVGVEILTRTVIGALQQARKEQAVVNR
ncbi:amidohydrolase [Kurthia sibirica]|uniref:Amidohydrolase n=1 Tax=Kurthia sibirica TaxID=202750 RepID=A0A2U3AK70_9BACL|nr:amidohydrolase [Kurthia sibirica]PWI24936.1 amidohydrolase [Kurthia sibirica]GEK33153.1 amidohydrolase AmhX [Kurthia sibirica]